MPRQSNLASLSVDALFKLRDDVAAVLSSRTIELRRQLSKLTGDGSDGSVVGKGKKRGRKPRKVAAKYRSKKNPKLKWAGRGATPVWMREEMKGTKLKKEDFAIK